jgi:L-asparaginase II
MEQANPILVEVTRAARVESQHRGAACVYDAAGARVMSWGSVEAPVYPRSAVKFIQALPFLESGAADYCHASFPELALAAASHTGQAQHIAVARAWMERLGLNETHFACGAHFPYDPEASAVLVRSGAAPSPLHNNCSGKHLAMLATALARREPLVGYHEPSHPVQQRVRDILAELTGEDLAEALPGVDGCSLPTWPVSLAGLARAMALIADARGLRVVRQSAIRRLRNAIVNHPLLIGGLGTLCSTVIARKGVEIYVKGGAEGVFCAAMPELGVGLALKIDDGARRAAEVALGAILRYLEVLDDADWAELAPFVAPQVFDRAGREVGVVRPVAGWPYSRSA